MSRRKSAALLTGVIAVISGGLGILAAPNASAAETGSCSGYSLRFKDMLVDQNGKEGGGEIRLYQIGKTTAFCAVMNKKGDAYGHKTQVELRLNPIGKGRDSDNGNFAYYAGPVKANASGCLSILSNFTYKDSKYSYYKKGWCEKKSAPPASAAPSSAKAAKAIAYAKAQMKHPSYDWAISCELFVEKAYGKSGLYGSAADARRAHGSLHKGYDAPAGALIFLSSNSFPSWGHVALSAGGGYMYTTGMGTGIKKVTIKSWDKNHTYYGWDYPNSKFTK